MAPLALWLFAPGFSSEVLTLPRFKDLGSFGALQCYDFSWPTPLSVDYDAKNEYILEEK